MTGRQIDRQTREDAYWLACRKAGRQTGGKATGKQAEGQGTIVAGMQSNTKQLVVV